MAACGMNLKSDAFTKRLQGGAHLLAPTGSDLQKHDVGTTLAGFHYDISFLTCHGKSRYPGLYIWLKDWTKVAVKIPDGCLLLQAGSTFEHMTAGYVLAGYHEVMYTEDTKKASERVKEQMKNENIDRNQWRVSSTLFSMMRYDVDISPLPDLAHLYDKE